MSAELSSIGLEVEEDGAAGEVGGDTGNLLVRIDGRSPRCVMLCAHLDTVPHDGPMYRQRVEAPANPDPVPSNPPPDERTAATGCGSLWR